MAALLGIEKFNELILESINGIKFKYLQLKYVEHIRDQPQLRSGELGDAQQRLGRGGPGPGRLLDSSRAAARKVSKK